MSTPEFLAGASSRGRYRFGDFVLDLEGGFLRRNGAEVSLRPKAFDVLRYLVLHHGTLVTKDELARAVWADVAVTDNSLAQCLLEIRRALEDDEQRIVRTVARRGYVFDAPVATAFADPRHVPEPAAILKAVPDSTRQVAATMRRRRLRSWGLALAVIVVLAAALAAWPALRLRPSAAVDETPVQLTNFSDTAIAPALSNDGRVLAFIRGGLFGKVGAPGGQVYVKLLESGAPVQLTRDSMLQPHTVHGIGCGVIPSPQSAVRAQYRRAPPCEEDRSDTPPVVLWPAGLNNEANVARNPGARVINAAFTMPASGVDTYLFARQSTQSNLYRVRIPE